MANGTGPVRPSAAAKLLREHASVIIGAVLGGLLTGVPTIWVASSQLRSQVELAKRAEAEQQRQRRLTATQHLLSACADGALVAQRMSTVRNDDPAFGSGVLEWQQTQNRMLLAYAEVFAEFPLEPRRFGNLGGATCPAPSPAVQGQTDAELAQRLGAMAEEMKQSCKHLVSSLLSVMQQGQETSAR